MNFTTRTIPYQQTGFFSRAITDYLSGNEFLRSFYEHPVSYDGIEAAIHHREKFPTDRNLLIRSLEEQYAGLPVQEAVRKNLESLSGKNTFTVTTAHQPAIFTGNLYFIYKILHVIRDVKTQTWMNWGISSWTKKKSPGIPTKPARLAGCIPKGSKK